MARVVEHDEWVARAVHWTPLVCAVHLPPGAVVTVPRSMGTTSGARQARRARLGRDTHGEHDEWGMTRVVEHDEWVARAVHWTPLVCAVHLPPGAVVTVPRSMGTTSEARQA